jgi:hypothetical protein
LSRETLFGPRGYVSAPRTVAAAASG